MNLRTLAFPLGVAAICAIGAFHPVQADTTIFDIQQGLVPQNTIVEVDDVVVTGVGRFGFFVQEPDPNPDDPTRPREYSGLWVYTAGNHEGIHRGALVNVKGEYYEYFGLAEIDITADPTGFVLRTGDGTIPDPVLFQITDINQTGFYSENYEGVYVRVDSTDATLYSAPPDANENWGISHEPTEAGDDTLRMDTWSGQSGDDFIYAIPDSGSLLTFAKGILVYNFDEWKLAPRDCVGDLGTACKPILQGAYCTSNSSINVEFAVPLDAAFAEDTGHYELASGQAAILSAALDPEDPRIVQLTTGPLTPGAPDLLSVFEMKSEAGAIQDQEQDFEFRTGLTPIAMVQGEGVIDPAVDDASPLVNEIVSLRGTVTYVGGSYYWIQDDDGGPWDGIYSRVARSGALHVGDVVQFAGVVTEYFGLTEINYQSGVNYYENLGPSPAPVHISDVTAAEIPYQGADRTAEPYESCLVRLTEATVDSAGTGAPAFGEWQLLQGALPDTAGLDQHELQFNSYDACIGDVITVTGLLNYAFSAYRIAPRSGRGGDIQVVFDNPDCAPVGVGGDGFAANLQMQQNAPNPFVGQTQIVLRLPTQTRVQLDILDVSGRLVRGLVDQTFQAGEATIHWDGRDDAHHEVPAGTYFYRLRADGTQVSRKMVVMQ